MLIELKFEQCLSPIATWLKIDVALIFGFRFPASFLSMFYRRISSQLHQLQSFVFMFCGMLDQPNKLGATNLVRDKFGLHKIIVAVSKVGKVIMN